MSVMLTATKSAVRKAKSARPVKSAKQRPQKPAGPKLAPQCVKMWQWTMDDEPVTLLFRRDTMEIWVNDEKVTAMNSFAEDSDGATLQFKCLEQEGRITTCRNELGEIDQVLTINGILIE